MYKASPRFRRFAWNESWVACLNPSWTKSGMLSVSRSICKFQFSVRHSAGFDIWLPVRRKHDLSRCHLPTSALGRLHGGLTQQCRGVGRRHELDEFASRILIRRYIADGDAEVAVFDKAGRQGAEIL